MPLSAVRLPVLFPGGISTPRVGVSRSNSYVRIVFTSDRLPRRKFLNTASPKLAGISGLLSRSSIRLDSQTFNIIWHNLSLATTVRPSLSLWCARHGCSKPSCNFHVVVTVLGVVECFRHAGCHGYVVTSTSVAFLCRLRKRRRTATGTVTIENFSLPPCVPVLSR